MTTNDVWGSLFLEGEISTTTLGSGPIFYLRGKGRGHLKTGGRGKDRKNGIESKGVWAAG